MKQYYFKPVQGGIWAASIHVEGRWIHLIQDRSLYDPGDAALVLFHSASSRTALTSTDTSPFAELSVAAQHSNYLS